MTDEKSARKNAEKGGSAPDAQKLKALAEEGLRMRRELEKRIAPMKIITASDLQARSR